jgi:UDP-N-acetylmuramate dehydrogenase
MSEVQQLSQLTDLLGHVLENEPLSKHTTLRIGGPAKFWFDAKTSDDMIRAVEAAKELGLNFYVLGSGSNVLAADSGFDGLIIHAVNNNLRTQGDKLYVEAGAINAQVVRETAAAGLTGLEWLATIPGTIGGAVYGNAGCFGESIRDYINKVDVYRNGAKKRLEKKDCQFGYRDSIFKRNKDMILSAEFNLKEGSKGPSLKKIEEYAKKRKESQPVGQTCAGSTFKNYKIRHEDDIKKLMQRVKEIPDDFLQKKYLPAGWLLEQVGAKGMEIGDMQVSEDHANWLINRGKAGADDFIMLVSKLKTLVRDELGVQLTEEIQYIGF